MPTNNPETLVLLSKMNGLTVISTKTQLTRLNYFDGKFLRAADLKAEQDYLRRLVQFSNQADGPGVAHGFDLTLGGGDTLLVGQGLAIDPAGRVLLLPGSTSISIPELIEQSRNQDLVSTAAVKKEAKESGFADCEMASATPPTHALQPGDMYLITVAHAEGYCGEEDVYGKLCEEACATSTDRPFVVEGLVFRAEPLPLKTLLATSKAVALMQAHRRSLIASAYFNDERNRIASLISGAGLKSDVWCFGADGVSGGAVPLGVLCRTGTATLFLDVWTVRRERIDTPAKRYWQWRMRMRPWDVFLAHILQFQCQLRDLFRTTPVPGAIDPCDEAHKLVAEASDMLVEITKFYEAVSGRLTGLPYNQPGFINLPGGIEGVKGFQRKLQVAKETRLLLPSNRLLINGGIVELPSAGYLPVAPGETLSVNEQVERMMGEGVNLRFCVVRPDYVAHALEEAQHMERISLIEGLDDPGKKPEVDILVPDGEIIEQQQPSVSLRGFEGDLKFKAKARYVGETQGDFTLPIPDVDFSGAARAEKVASGGSAVYLSCVSTSRATPLSLGFDLESWQRASSGTTFEEVSEKKGKGSFGDTSEETVIITGPQPRLGLWLSLRIEHDLFTLKPGDVTNLSAQMAIGLSERGAFDLEFRGEISGQLTLLSPKPTWPIVGSLAATCSYQGGNFPSKTLSQTFEVYGKRQGATNLELHLNSPETNFMLQADWNALSAVAVKLAYIMTPNSRTVFDLSLDGWLSDSTIIFSPINYYNVSARQALDFVGGALKDPAFAAAKGKLLFPSELVKKPSSKFLVRGTRDWVLFHRRRTEQCGLTAVAQPSRRYRVYQMTVMYAPGDFRPESLPTKEHILRVTPEEWKPFIPLGVVSFGGGVATFDSDISAVKSAWKSVPGGSILWGVIASRGDAVKDGDALAQSRVAALESVLDPVDPSARIDVLPAIPPPAQSADVDGIIVLINGQPKKGYTTYTNPVPVQTGIGAKNL